MKADSGKADIFTEGSLICRYGHIYRN
jgi:hypothetical protein